MTELDLPKKKYKILTLCDHPMSTSGVGVQAGLLFNGLINTGKYKFVSLGGAMKHADYRVMQPSADIIIKPVDGFGSKEQVRQLLLSERPDALFIFTDPRQFIWLWEMADEVRQICPIAYWHVWDNGPYPAFNKVWYDSTDLINCLSHKTFEMVKPNFPERTNYIPHAFPKEMYFPMAEEQVKSISRDKFGDRADWFKVLWVNRNATRKLGADVISCFSQFLDTLEKKYGHRKALMIMHTDPYDMEGANLVEVSSLFGLKDHVMFSTEKLEAKDMNLLHNLCEVNVNIAKAEGFGLSTLIHMMTGKPIIALKTGGMTRQVVDYRDGFEHGVGIPVTSQILVGSQMVPYIYEDFCSNQLVVDAFMKIHDMTTEEKMVMKEKILAYVDHEFNYGRIIEQWDQTLEASIKQFKKSNSWTFEEIVNNNQQTTSKQKTKEIFKQNDIILDPEVKKLPIDITNYLMKNIKVTRMNAQ